MKDGPDAVQSQIAALPLRRQNGKLRVLMVTSRETRRWVMPKGWLMDGKKPWRAAQIEALEEAGAIGSIHRVSIGSYHYTKRGPDGAILTCRVTVYPMVVERLKRNWKERDERKRRWFSPRKAAKLVNEPELAMLLEEIAEKRHKQPVIRALLKAS
jgi:8-oxo-dGTP pyrophosphatase MutT (NUDIX family)